MSPVAVAPYLLTVLVLALLGRLAARPLRLPTEGLEGFAFAYGLGTGVGSLLLLALVSVRALGLPSGTAGLPGGPGTAGPGPWDAVLWLGFLVALAELVRRSRARAEMREAVGPGAPVVPPRPPPSPRGMLRVELLPLGLALLLVLSALAPEVGIDALAVHLPASARLVRDGVRPMAGLLGGEGRLGFTLLAAPRLDGTWPVGPALLHTTAGLALVAAIHAEIARRVGRRIAAATAALLLATPVLALPSATLGTELALGLHAGLALLCAARAGRSGVAAHVLAAGLFAGFAANDELGGLPVVLATGLALHVGLGARRGMRPALAAGGLGLVLTVPWVLRAWRDTGNLLFPFATERFGAGWADPTIVSEVTLSPYRGGGPLLGLVERIGVPFRAALHRGDAALLPLVLLLAAAAPLAFRLPRGPGPERRALVAGGSLLAVLGLAAFPAARFLVPVLGLVAIGAATALARLAAGPARARAAAIGLGALVVLAGAWDAAVSARVVAPRIASLRSTAAATALVDGAWPELRAGAAFAATVPGPILFASEVTAPVDADAVSTTPARNGLLPAARLALPSNAYLREEMRRRRWAAFVYRPARAEDAVLAGKALDLFRRRLGTMRTSADGTWQAFVLDARR